MSGCGDACASCRGCASKRTDEVAAILAAGASRVLCDGTAGALSPVPPARVEYGVPAGSGRPDALGAAELARQHGAAVRVPEAWVTPVRLRLGEGRPIHGVLDEAAPGRPGAARAAIERAVRAGASEVDLPMPLELMRARDYAGVLRFLERCVEAARPAGLRVVLSPEADACMRIQTATLAALAGARGVRTGAWFAPSATRAREVATLAVVLGGSPGSQRIEGEAAIGAPASIDARA